ncbi:MAG: hemerythrin domain-containing protein [Planctomycetes bacterium]|nr:hemerythrin domain-containing protein [Planctomycetota bacterium]
MKSDRVQSDKESIVHEHAQLRHIFDSVRETLLARQATPQVIAALTVELSSHVKQHFDHEEQGGYFEEAIELAPRFSDRAKLLLQQHLELAAQLDELQQHADSSSEIGPWWAQLTQLFDEFMHRFLAHEEAENALLLQVYNEDIGAED